MSAVVTSSGEDVVRHNHASESPAKMNHTGTQEFENTDRYTRIQVYGHFSRSDWRNVVPCEKAK